MGLLPIRFLGTWGNSSLWVWEENCQELWGGGLVGRALREALCKANPPLPPPGWTLKCSSSPYPTPSSQARSSSGEKAGLGF